MTMCKVVLRMLLGLLCAAGLSQASGGGYNFSQAGNFPGADNTYPFAINGKHIVGYFQTSNVIQGYVQTGHSFIRLGHLAQGETLSYAGGINVHGVVVGGYCTSACDGGSGQFGFSDDHGKVTTLQYPGLVNGSTTADGINDLGQIVGGFCVQSSYCPLSLNAPSHGFLYDPVNGYTQIDYPGSQGTGAAAINNAGAIVGQYFLSNVGPYAFLLQNGVFTKIDFPGAFVTLAVSINNSGVVAGTYENMDGSTHGFTYQNGVFATVDVPQALTTGVHGINDSGDVVGWWTHGLTFQTFKGIPRHAVPVR